MKTLNAIITDVDIQFEEAFLTMGLWLDIEGGGCIVFGSSRVLHRRGDQFTRVGTNCAGFFISQIMEIARAEKLSQLKGKPIRAIFERDGMSGDRIIGIQDFLTNATFIPRDVFDNEKVSPSK